MSSRDKVFVDIITNDNDASKKLKNLAVVGGTVATAFKAMYDAGKEMYELFKVQEQAEVKLNATLKATGFAANLGADALTNMASALQQTTRFGDEAIIGAQSLLLTFRNIGEETFPRALETILDMSEALGQDLKSSSIQLGKALNDPIQGITALSRVGVSFTEEQKATIEKMIELNDVAGAQAVILKELEEEFGGVAEAAAQASTGALDQFKNAMNDGKEVGGEFIAYTMEPIVRWFTELVSSSNDGKNALMDLNKAFETIESGGDAGDLTNEIRTQLGIIREIEDGLYHQFGMGKENLKQARVALGVLIEQQKAYEEQVEETKRLAKNAEERKEAENRIASILARQKGVEAELIEQGIQADEERRDLVNERLSAADQEKARIQEQLDYYWEIVHAFEERRDAQKIVSGEEHEAIKNIKELIYELNQEYKAVVETQLEGNEEIEEQQTEFFEAFKERFEERLEKLQEEHDLKQKFLEEEWEARQEYNDYIEETQERLLKIEEEKQEAIRKNWLETFDVISGGLNALGNLISATYDQQITDIDEAEAAAIEALDNQKLSEEEYAAAKEKMMEDYDEKRKEIQRQQAIQEKSMAIFEAIINTAAAIVKALPSIPLSIAAGVTGAIQTAAIAAQPIPAFAEGGSFQTSGETVIKVGDNSGGVEQIDITPISSTNYNGPQNDVPIQNNIYLNKELFMKIITAGTKNGQMVIHSGAIV
jgi:hypothetical protein